MFQWKCAQPRWMNFASAARLTLIAFLAFAFPKVTIAETEAPNIVLILADDMGYGDVQALNPGSKIPTPHLNRLAKEGVTFQDTHTPSAVCTPTRYGLITGRYCWRTQLKRGVLGGYSAPLIRRDRQTIASMLKSAGYYTAAVGKWHLGMNFPMKPGVKPALKGWDGDPGVNFAGKISNGPTTRGFDEYFGVSASLDMPPYVFIENDHFRSVPELVQPRMGFPAFVRTGPRSKDFELAEVLDQLTARAGEIIRREAKTPSPFFLYFALPAPHKPALPHKRFRGNTELGPYGDFVTQVDWTVGQVLKSIDDAQITQNTLVIYTSDNGSYMYRYDDPAAKDHVDLETIQGYRKEHHQANGPFRGTKADIWEGGHHVPFLVRWPAVAFPGSESRHPICLVDVFRTAAEVSGGQISDGMAEDSVSFLPVLKGNEQPRGTPVIHHSANGMFAIRDGQWKLVLGNGSGGRQQPRGKAFMGPYPLFNLAEDISETDNVAKDNPEVKARLLAAFRKIAVHDLLQSDRKLFDQNSK